MMKLKWCTSHRTQVETGAMLFMVIACHVLQSFLVSADTPKIQSFSFPEDLSAGQSAKAICTTVSGSGPLSFKWFKDGVLIDYVSHTRVRNQDDLSILTISPLVAGSSGHYTCEVSNSYGSDSFTADLVVRVPPYWVSEPKDSSVNRGGTVTINCTASGYPQPVITWRRLIGPNQDGNGMLTINTNGRHVVHPNGALTIRQVTLDDVGDYLCIASNNQGTDLSKVVQFRVHVPASFEEKSSSQTVLRGDSARLTCEALGDRPVTITWTKDRSPLSNKDEDAARYSIFERISENGTLSEIHLEQVERHDSAHYACTAQNAYGKDERTIKLVVLEVPSAPLEVRLDHAWSRSVSLSWSKPFNGNSPITKFIIQYWRDAGAPHRLEEKVVPASQTSVVITDLQPGTSYAVRVLAENEVGRGTPSSIQQLVTQEEEPEAPPTDLWVEAKGAGALKIRWKAPPKDHWNGRLKGYYLSYKVHGSDPFAFKTVPFQDSGLEQELILTGLQKSTKYTVNVKAYNSAGSGPVSQEVTVTTSEDDPPPPPSIWVAEQTTTSITLKWDQRDEPNVQITHYTLYYKEDQSGWLEIAFPVTSEFYTLTGLKEGTWYQLRMRATSKQGQSDNSEVLTVRTDGEAPVDKPSQHLQTNEEPQIPPYLRISVVAPVAIAVVIIALVLIGACVYVKLEQKRCPNMEEGVPTKQFQYTSTATLPRMAARRYVDVDKTRPLLPTPGFPPHPPSEGYPSPYATMPLRGATFDRRRFNHEEFRGGGAMISDHNCHHGSMRKKPRAFQECAEIHHYDEPA